MRRSARRVESLALLVRSVEYGEADVIATLLTEAEGRVSLIVRGARRGGRRVGGALEPFHTLKAVYEDRGSDLATLTEATLVRVRLGLTSRLDALDAAGQALRWARHLCPPRTPEPAAWATLTELLDRLEDPASDPRVEVAAAGLRLLGDMGYALEFDRCVRCGKRCPEDRAGSFDPSRGGLVCQACGGGQALVPVATRRAAMAVQRGGLPAEVLSPAHAAELIGLVDAAMIAHTEFDA